MPSACSFHHSNNKRYATKRPVSRLSTGRSGPSGISIELSCDRCFPSDNLRRAPTSNKTTQPRWKTPGLRSKKKETSEEKERTQKRNNGWRAFRTLRPATHGGSVVVAACSSDRSQWCSWERQETLQLDSRLVGGPPRAAHDSPAPLLTS